MAKKWKTLSPHGNVGTQTLSVNDAPKAVPSPADLPITNTFATAVMAAEENDETISLLPSTTSVDPTTKNGPQDTGWTKNLLTIVDEPWELLEDLDLSALPPHQKAKLLILADGRNEPVAAVIHEMCAYLAEMEAPQCEGPMIDGVVFYLENEVV